MFVPAGCPHRVENLDTSLAISGNFVDLSNFDLVKEELTLNSLIDERAAELLKQFSDPDFKAKMCSDICHVSWEKFKMWPPEDYEKFDVTPEIVQEERNRLQNTWSVRLDCTRGLKYTEVKEKDTEPVVFTKRRSFLMTNVKELNPGYLQVLLNDQAEPVSLHRRQRFGKYS